VISEGQFNGNFCSHVATIGPKCNCLSYSFITSSWPLQTWGPQSRDLSPVLYYRWHSLIFILNQYHFTLQILCWTYSMFVFLTKLPFIKSLLLLFRSHQLSFILEIQVTCYWTIPQKVFTTNPPAQLKYDWVTHHLLDQTKGKLSHSSKISGKYVRNFTKDQRKRGINKQNVWQNSDELPDRERLTVLHKTELKQQVALKQLNGKNKDRRRKTPDWKGRLKNIVTKLDQGIK